VALAEDEAEPQGGEVRGREGKGGEGAPASGGKIMD